MRSAKLTGSDEAGKAQRILFSKLLQMAGAKSADLPNQREAQVLQSDANRQHRRRSGAGADPNGAEAVGCWQAAEG
jgi:hypothetical protein